MQMLDLSYNHIAESALLVIASFPKLKHLDLTGNDIYSFPEEIRNMVNWKERVMELAIPHHAAVLEKLFSGDPRGSAMSRRSDKRESIDKVVRLREKLYSREAKSALLPDLKNIGFPKLTNLVLVFSKLMKGKQQIKWN